MKRAGDETSWVAPAGAFQCVSNLRLGSRFREDDHRTGTVDLKRSVLAARKLYEALI